MLSRAVSGVARSGMGSFAVARVTPTLSLLARRGMAVKFTVVGEDGSQKQVEGKEGQTLLQACQDAQVPLGGRCGGSQACGTCHVFVTDAEKYKAKWNAINEDEQEMLSSIKFARPNSRLGCSLVLAPHMDGMTVTHKPKGSKK